MRAPDLPCTPVVHENARRGRPLYEGYVFLGASQDGKRLAFAASHMGPGSGQPVGGAHVVEAGAAKEVFSKGYFDVHGGAADLPKVEAGIRTEYASELAAAGVEVGQQPEPEAWCAAPSGAIYTASGAQLELRAKRSPCAKDPAHQTLGWEVCTKDGAHCARSSAAECLDGELSLHDLVRTGGTDWVVVDVLTRPFPDSEFHLYEVAGETLGGS